MCSALGPFTTIEPCDCDSGGPHEIWYRYGGRQLGYDGNNGNLDTDYLTSIISL